MDKVTIIQHNVAHWNPYRHTLTNIYRDLDPDILLINSHGLHENEMLKIYGYTTYKVNSTNELHDGSAILIKSNIQHKIKDDFITDILQVTIETNIGPVNFATTYIPPRRHFFPYPDFHSLTSNSTPTYILADLNAKHHILGHNSNNTVGTGIKNMIDINRLTHLGPNFSTYFSANYHSTPDIILANRHIYHNHYIERGPATASDHLPIIFTISASATKKLGPLKYNLKAANWENFQRDINVSLQNNHITEHSTIEQIDSSLDHWYNTITNAMTLNIPKTNQRQFTKPIHNNTIKLLQHYINNMMNEATARGWTQIKYRTFKILKKALIKEAKTQHTKNWEKTIRDLGEKYKNPTLFWKEIKRLRGNTDNRSPYII